MASISMTSRETARGEAPVLDAQDRRFAARRTAFLMALLVLLVVVALAANYGPLSHYLQARERLQETTARVEALEQQAAGLQAQLGKLSESGYLEDMARRDLTYALPDEDLFIVTGAEEAGDDGDSGNRDANGDGETGSPGPLERLLRAAANLF